MATFTEIAFSGTITSLAKDFAWIPISPSKVAILYSATISTTRHFFIQMMTFSGGAAPVMSTPCSLGTVTNTLSSIFCRGAYLRDNLLIISLPTAFSGTASGSYPTSYTYNVVAFDNLDQFNLVSNSASVANSSSAYFPTHEMTSYNNRVFVARRQNGQHNFSEITVDSSNVVTIVPRGTVTYTTSAVQNASQYARRAGKYWLFCNNVSSTQSGPNVLMVCNLEAATCTAYPTTNLLLPTGQPLGCGRTTTPLSGDVLELDNDTTSFRRINSSGAIVATNPWRAAVAGGIEDVYWLDDMHFMIFMNGATTATAFSATTTTAGATSVQVGRYDENANTIVSSGAAKSLGISSFRECFNNFIHRIDETHIALIGGWQLLGPTRAGLGTVILSI